MLTAVEWERKQETAGNELNENARVKSIKEETLTSPKLTEALPGSNEAGIATGKDLPTLDKENAWAPASTDNRRTRGTSVA
eukprot:scaffold1292_cov105-Pinguiococcus_pyrenoidosus.AAC.1